MVSGPTKEKKRKSSLVDTSHHVEDEWYDILHHGIIICLIAVIVWGFCSLIRWSITFGFESLFAPFMEGELSLSELNNHLYYVLGILLGGAFIRGIMLQFHGWKSAEGDGVSQSLEYFHSTYEQGEKAIKQRFSKPTFLEAIKRMIMTSLTIGTGSSGGLEAPVIPVGECVASGWSKIFKVKRIDNIRAYQMVGISAAVATLLNAPLAAALFAAEILYADRILYRSFIFSLLGAIIAYALNNHFLNFPPLFEAPSHSQLYTIDEYFKVILVSIVFCAPAALGLNILFRWLKEKISIVPPMWRALVGALGVAAIVYLYWVTFQIAPHHLLGVGEESLNQILNHETPSHMQVWWVLVLIVIGKTLTTGLTLMAGGSAGLLVPAMVIGGTSGAAVFEFFHQMGWAAQGELSLFVISGIAASLVSVIDVPISAIALVMEIFGSHYGPAAIVASVLCYLIAKRLNLYASRGVSSTSDRSEG